MADFEQIDSSLVPPARRNINLADFEPGKEFAAIDEADMCTFLENLMDTGSPMISAQKMGRSEIEFQSVRSTNAAFAAAWVYAQKMSAEYLSLEARRRAIEGTIKQIWHKGEVVGSIREYSDTLLSLMLKAFHPSYGGIDAAPPTSGNVTININSIPSGHFVKVDDENSAEQNADPKHA